MSRPRRTIRQYFFAAKSRVRSSGRFAWMWTILKVVIVLLLTWAIARLMGLPIEEEVLKLLR